MVVGAVRFDRRTRRNLRLNAVLTIVGILSIATLLAWLSLQYPYAFDATASGRNTLSQASSEVLDQLSGAVTVTAYARNQSEHRSRITDLVERYRRHKPDLELHFVDPDAVPDELRKLGISTDGELVVRYANRNEHVLRHTEQALSNALQRLGRSKDQWLVFLDGHGERRPLGKANHDLGAWGVQLEKVGFKVQSLNLAKTAAVPHNAAVLIIASPQVSVLPDELQVILSYVEGGGNLLWFTDPERDDGLDALASALGVSFVPGTIVDPASRQLRNVNPTFAVVANYAPHASTDGFRYLTLFPRAAAIQVADDSRYTAHVVLETGHSAWSEAGILDGEVSLDAGVDTAGPLVLGLSLTRARGAQDIQTSGEQRVAVIGDGDFLSNAYLGNSGNLDLGLRIVTWLAADDDFVKIPARSASGQQLELTETAGVILALGFLLVIPLCLAASGTAVWWRRRRS